MKTQTLEEFISTPLELTKEVAVGVLQDLREDLIEHPFPEVFCTSRYDKSELIRALDVLLEEGRSL